ncbi:hypothetical protein L7F22_062753 [Adiantum nelumboides]|nr:hypothetical protein [Adiantum nelumboides]
MFFVLLNGLGVDDSIVEEDSSEIAKGDVIALPKGTVYWWYNDGNGCHRVLCVSDTRFGANPGCFHQFGLADSKQAKFGSVLHGFSKESLAIAWGVDKQTIQSLLDSQNEAGIVKAKQKICFPQIPKGRREEEEEEEDRNTFTDRMRGPFYFEELKYNIKNEVPHFCVRNGGSLNRVNCHKLPALHQIGFSAVKVTLEKNAMMAPSFVRNAHQLFYFTRGSGRVQVASGDGQNVFNEEVKKAQSLGSRRMLKAHMIK